MGAVKDLYMDMMEEKMQELIDEGYSEEEAYEIAGERAYRDLGDRMADMADAARQREKDKN